MRGCCGTSGLQEVAERRLRWRQLVLGKRPSPGGLGLMGDKSAVVHREDIRSGASSSSDVRATWEKYGSICKS